MERKGVFVPAVLAVGAAAVYLAVLSGREKALRRDYEPGAVLVARVDIPERTVLKEDMVETMSVPRKFMAQDAFEIKTRSDVKLIDNLVTRVRVPKGNQIVQSGLVSLSPEAGLSTKVPPGYRGAVVPVDSELLHLVKPGDRVDLLVTFDALMGSDNRREKVTATILQNVMVLGVGRNLGQGAAAGAFARQSAAEVQAAAFSEKGYLSLAINPMELQYLALILRQGDLMIGLRGLGDAEMHPIKMISLRSLLQT